MRKVISGIISALLLMSMLNVIHAQAYLNPYEFVIDGSIGLTTLDPAMPGYMIGSYYEASGELLFNVYEPLIFLESERCDTFIPMLATQVWVAPPDPMAPSYTNFTLYFKIRIGVPFHTWCRSDIAPTPSWSQYYLTTEDVEHSFERLMVYDYVNGPQCMLYEPLLSCRRANPIDPAFGYKIDNAVQRNETHVWFNIANKDLSVGVSTYFSPIQLFDASGHQRSTFWSEVTSLPINYNLGILLQVMSQPWASIMSKRWLLEYVDPMAEAAGHPVGEWPGSWGNWTRYWYPGILPTPLPCVDIIPSGSANPGVVCGTGPYILDKLYWNYEWSVVKFNGYWRGWPTGTVERLTLRQRSIDARIRELLAGECDFSRVTLSSWSNFHEGGDIWGPTKQGIRLYRVQPLVVNSLHFTFDIEPTPNNFYGKIYPAGELHEDGIPRDFFSDIHVRKAFVHCINFSMIIRDLQLGEAYQPNTFAPASLTYVDPAIPKYGFDIEMAKEEFQRAWGGRLDDIGFTVTITYNSESYVRWAICSQIATIVNDVGNKIANGKFHVAIRAVNWNDYLEDMDSHLLPIFVVGWMADYADIHNFAFAYAHSLGTFAHMQRYNNPVIDTLIDSGVYTPNGPVRERIYKDVQLMYYQDVPSVPLFTSLARIYMRDWVYGWRYNPLYPGIYAYHITKTLNQPPTCVIKLQKEGVEISEVAVGEFFDIYVGDSTDDTGITQVRFSSDDVQDGIPTGEWTKWYEWSVSEEDWNAETKIKRWAFATPGHKEVWAEVKDDVGQTDSSSINILATLPQIVIIAPLEITPNGPYYVGETLTATFTIKNIGSKSATLDVLTVGGRDPDGLVLDFEWEMGIVLNPGAEHTYTGRLTLSRKTGTYHFFCAYRTQFGYWNPSIDLSAGLTDEDRAEDIIVYETPYEYPLGGIIIPEEIFPEGKGQAIPIYVPPVFEGSNVIREGDGWRTIKVIEKSRLNFEWEKMVTSFAPEQAQVWSPELNKYVDTPQGAAISFISSFIMAVNSATSRTDFKITIQQGPEGKFRAIIELADTETTTFMRTYAGSAYMVTFEMAYLKVLFSKYVAEVFHLEPEGWNTYYTMGIRIDQSHKEDQYVYYLSLSRDNRIVTTPKVYPQDVLEVIRVHEFIFPYKLETVKELTGNDFVSFGASFVGEEESKYILKILAPICLVPESAIIAQGHSPIELRVYDSQGRVTGLINGEIKEEIPNSIYSDESKTVIIFNPSNAYFYEVVGTNGGTYGLDITFLAQWNVTAFTASQIPIINGSIHLYNINWTALSLGEEGVTVQVDSDGDGVFEHTFTSDNELSHDEFVLQTETTIDIDPDTLNLIDKGKWITAYIEFPEGYNVTDINVSTILLNGSIPIDINAPLTIGDYDNDSIPDLMVKFDRAEVISYILANIDTTKLYEERFMTVTLTITGKLNDGTPFQGSTTIRVILLMPKCGRFVQFL